MFDTAQIIPTKLALAKAKMLNLDLLELIMNHSSGNWDGLTKTEIQLNNKAIEDHGVIYSRYNICGEVFIVVSNLKEQKTFIKMVEEA